VAARFGGARRVAAGLVGVRRFAAGLASVRRFAAGLPGVRRFAAGLPGVRRFAAGLPGVRRFAAGLPGVRRFAAVRRFVADRLAVFLRGDAALARAGGRRRLAGRSTSSCSTGSAGAAVKAVAFGLTRFTLVLRGARDTPSRLSSERPVAIACGRHHAAPRPVVRSCSRTNSPAWVEADLPARNAARAFSTVL
jgi:hypothetical protein